jgi:hypothetical protein
MVRLSELKIINMRAATAEEFQGIRVKFFHGFPSPVLYEVLPTAKANI